MSRTRPEWPGRRAAELTSRLLDAGISDDEWSELDALVRDDPEARRAYLRIVGVHLDLMGRSESDAGRDSAGTRSGDESPPRPLVTAGAGAIRLSDRRGWPFARFLPLVGLSLLLLAAGAGWGIWSLARPPVERLDPRLASQQAEAAAPVATIRAVSRDARLGEQQPIAGDSLETSKITLEAGVMEIRLPVGVTALLDARDHAVRIDLADPMRVRLESGAAVFRVSPEAIGFRCETRDARVIDLGTEFGVSVRSGGETQVQVFDGEVIAEAIDSVPGASTESGDTGTSEQSDSSAASLASTRGARLESGEAVQITAGRREPVPFWPEQYVRFLPDPDAERHGRGRSTPYNEPVHESVDILVAETAPTIDGQLDDWQLGGQFESQCEEPYAAYYRVRGALMYDATSLYVAADVSDPFPLRSVCPPLADGQSVGRGGCVALRIGTDREMGWPVRGRSASSSRELTDEDRSEHLNFVVLWYYAAENQACVQITQGMDFHRRQINPDGYSGAFVKRPDGLGYTMEYAIPWSLLAAGDDPPQPGDVLGLTWLTHWAGPDGRQWRGQLIDIVNPDAEGWNFQNAATWGRAIYKPPSEDARHRGQRMTWLRRDSAAATSRTE